MAKKREPLNRRAYLKAAGASGVALTTLAGCLEDAGNGDDDADAGNGNGDDTDDGNGDDASDEDTGNGDDTEDNQIIAGTAPGFEPFEMTRDGELVGFDIDHLEAVVEETDYELVEWEEYEFDSLIPALENERIDVIAAAMTITEEREESIAFSDPYYSADQSVLVETGAGFEPESLEDLEGSQVGAQSGTTGEGIVQDELIDEGLIEDDDYTSYDNYVYAIQDLERGLIDAIIIDEPVGNSFQDDHEVEVAFTYETDEQYGLGIRQGDDDLQAALNEGIAAVEESSEYDEITQEWFGE
ncbi:transporter substrate-binding domain-containing protein [Natronolimnobius baerhuensis]|uniref:Basic amino acid ABC transporter substrate-binding protein n=1 Tax=Natronolimnobius baerhuensis TaxID=253108 RepID=A0A202E654_9EURY|nr:transporter substrate-binding domain-containing protein [Natronolimnobius baerhuensis]OVE83674.1 basic amino acid ABC transporter substrate-binding protein [Natronolimnobius baerhuensis]